MQLSGLCATTHTEDRYYRTILGGLAICAVPVIIGRCVLRVIGPFGYGTMRGSFLLSGLTKRNLNRILWYADPARVYWLSDLELHGKKPNDIGRTDKPFRSPHPTGTVLSAFVRTALI